MRVLFVATETAPTVGGMQTWLDHMVRGLSARHNVAVAAPERADAEALLLSGAERVFPLRGPLPTQAGGAFSYVVDVLSAARAYRADVVHLAQAGLSFLVPPLSAAGFPTVVTVHGNDLTRPWLWLFDDARERASAVAAALRQASAVTSVSAFTARLAEGAGAGRGVDLVPNAVDLDVFRPGSREEARRRLGLPQGLPVVLSAGRLQERKGYLDVLEALAGLRELYPIYLIAGTAPEGSDLRARMESRAAQLGLAHQIRFLGALGADELAETMRASDVFALPVFERHDVRGFDHESFGIVYLEAGAVGLPCVAARAGGVPEVVADGETGFLVPPRDAASIERSLRALLTDGGLRRRMGEAAQARVAARFTLDRLAQDFEGVYERARTAYERPSHRDAIPAPPVDEDARRAIAELRERRGVDAGSLARAVRVAPGAWEAMEAGAEPMDPDLAQAASAYLASLPGGGPFRRAPAAPVEGALRYRRADDLGIVLAFFNPAGYESKIRNFEIATSVLSASGLHWMAVDCAMGDAPFAVEPRPNVLRLRARDAMWMKERLLNRLLDCLPSGLTKVAWLDADVLFANPDWAVETSSLLDAFPVVQPFSQAVRLPRGHCAWIDEQDAWQGFGRMVVRDPGALTHGDFGHHGHTGFAWAARRDALSAFGLYDACIVGSGDHFMAHAFSGDWESPCLDRIFGDNPAHRRHALAWCERMYPHVRARVRHVPGTLLHLWHGSRENRGYTVRNQELAAFGFDPSQDLRIGRGGCWEWSSDKPEMHDWLRRYFETRREDGPPPAV